MVNSTHSFREANLVLQLIWQSQVKVKLWWVGACKRKKREFFKLFILSEGKFFKICVLSQCIEYTFRIYILLDFKKRYFILFCCLFLKLSKSFSVFLTAIWSHIDRHKTGASKSLTHVEKWRHILSDKDS